MCDRPPIDQQITFLYTQNLAASASFYEDKLGLHLWLDQGTCRIYTVTGSGYLGLCQASEIFSTKITEKQSSVIFTLVTQQVDEWYEYLQQQGVEFEKPPTFNEKYKIYHCFLRDPNGYLIEIQRFESLKITSV
ncbi:MULTISPECIES: VOC family protein [unclassified Tolypothrix]|uniref:VOC family protein n=1 Tax=unclassified Tolypothrix TaxID=2649714 RepID=UPI0005EAB935|nr:MULTISPECIES: VOC family protein [unclassified Tolypothrix]BAY93420.1 glyoxalase/bleomycin resistance protein/dioxygenase [Microchaete diplosiphon NIES-3275]EKE99355.1 glyoxalase family protein [Tolypothrix sp. PCC 7601]MBE9082872.1 VOC family protein [Tolypothrix sp. LEGE 11397]UYD27269.1 VOC family protein [Tolypothrix sp. PCC 7712]UYD36872.1 VOC family protein [Tolypothrix sp. PCC 7601]